MADRAILGVFEDAGQRDFHLGIIESIGGQLGLDIFIVWRLTDGCHFDYLAEHLRELAPYVDGVIVGVDGKKLRRDNKIERLIAGLGAAGLEGIPEPILWSVAFPSIEEWIMADAQALPEVIREEYELDQRPTSRRPGGSRSERTAKKRLADWAEDLAGTRPLRGGLEYAQDVGRRLDASRVGTSRNPDLRNLVSERLPEFVRSL